MHPLAIETDRISSRLLAAGDEALYCGLYTDPDTMRFIGPPLSQTEARRDFRTALAHNRREPKREVYLALHDKESGRPLGLGAIQGMGQHARATEVGIMLLAPYRGRGYGTEGLRALISKAFAISPIVEVHFRFFAEHAVVERVALTLGFRRRGREGGPSEGSARELWSVERTDWRSHNE
ncbi:MAG TPA: GNAT family N-acetyltransferase [Steroidobacter sp.]